MNPEHVDQDSRNALQQGTSDKADTLAVTSSKKEPMSEVFDIHTDVIQRQLILKDMQRLYMNGVDNSYFQTEKRRNILQNVLCVWCRANLKAGGGGYKQGMHEIAAVMLLVIEKEYEGFRRHRPSKKYDRAQHTPEANTGPEDNKCGDSDDNSDDNHDQCVPCEWFCGNEQHTEMHTFLLFEKAMQALRVIYTISPANDATASAGAGAGVEKQLTMSSFLEYIQDVVIKALHPRLWEHLKICQIDPQLYGTGWSRLLFGRILQTNHAEQLCIWDYIFAPTVKTFPKLPFIKHSIPLGPDGSEYLGNEGGVRRNQFGLTDISKESSGLERISGGSFSDGDDSDEDPDGDQENGSEGWSLGKHWRVFQKKKLSPSKAAVPDSGATSGGVMKASSGTSVAKKEPVDTVDSDDDMSTDLANTTARERDELWRDSAPETVAETEMETETGTVTTAVTGQQCSVQNESIVEGETTDSGLDKQRVTEGSGGMNSDTVTAEGTKEGATKEGNEQDHEENENADWFDNAPYVSSDDEEEEEEAVRLAGRTESDSSESSLVDKWPFGSDQDVLLKVGCVSVAIIFKMRETLLRSSELGTITNLLRPLEQLRSTSVNGILDDYVFDVIRLSQQFESCMASNCALQPIPLHATADIMDFYNIRSASYSLDRLGAPTWRDASMCVTSLPSPTSLHLSSTTASSTVGPEKGWYLGKYLGKMVSGRNKTTLTADLQQDGIDVKMRQKRQLLKDYYSTYMETDGFSAEFSLLSNLPLMMGWLRKKKPRGPMVNYNKWKRRFIVLSRDTLAYYTSDTFEEKRGQFFLSPSTRAMVEDGTTEKHRIKFMIEDPLSKQKVRFFLVESDTVRQLWVSRINKAVELLKLAEQESMAALTGPAVTSPLSRTTTSSSSGSSGTSNNPQSSRGSGTGQDCPSSDEDEGVFEFSTELSFCRNMLVADDLKSYHYASGWLKKKNLIGGGWRLLFFELVQTEILFYTETANVAAKSPLGRIKISAETVVLNRASGKTQHKFAISTPSAPPAKRRTFQSLFGGGGADSSSSQAADHSRMSTADNVQSQKSRGSTSSQSHTTSSASSSKSSGSRRGVVFYCAASSAVEKDQWMEVIRDAVALLQQSQGDVTATGSSSGAK